MLELTGKCCSGLDAVAFMESLDQVISEKNRTWEFHERLEATRNRLRYEVAKGVGKKPKRIKAIYSRYKDYYNCGKCGRRIQIQDNYCAGCGTKILWENPRCLTKGEQEQEGDKNQ